MADKCCRWQEEIRRMIEFADSYQDFLITKKKYQVLIGSRYSGKTRHIIMKLAMILSSPEPCTILCIRQYKTQLKQSIYNEFMYVMEQMNLDTRSVFKVSPLEIIFKNGNNIIFGGLDDSSTYKSISAVSHVFVDEADKLSLEDFITINISIRGFNPKNHMFILAMNPISQTHWIKERFFDNTDPEAYTLKTTYKDILRYVPDSAVNEFERQKSENPNWYKVNALGEWGQSLTGLEIYNNFFYSKHVIDLSYDSNKILYLTFDENTSPYITCLCCHIEDMEVNVFEEICLTNLQLDPVCEYICSRFINHKGGIIITGDATSQKKNVYGATFYNFIMTRLTKLKPINRVSSINYSILNRTNWINGLLHNETIKIRFDKKCINTIKDFEGVKRGPDSKKDKKNKKGESYQEFGHCTDAFEYLLTTIFSRYFNEYQNGFGDFKLLGQDRESVNNMRY